MVTSFAPKDFGSGRWQGGPATIANPRFEYRPINTKDGPKTMVDFMVDYLDPEGGSHPARFNVGNSDLCRIRDAASDDANEAETGPAISHIDPTKVYRVSPTSEFGQFITSIVVGGFSESQLATGDVSVFDGVELETVTPKGKGATEVEQKADRFPLLLPTKVKQGTGAAGKAGKPSAKGTKAAAASTTAAPSAASTDDAKAGAASVIMETLQANNGQAVTRKSVVQAAINKFAKTPLKAAVVGLLSDNDFLMSGEWTFDPEDNTFMA